MTTHSPTLAKKFYQYQKERFPVFILALSLLPAILSSGAVISSTPTVLQFALALVASLAYLLHIRVIDEHRDYAHDNQHHTTRPIQSGLITRRELQYIDLIAILLLATIATAAGGVALLIVAAMFAYAYVAGKEFFIGERIRRYFFTYNAVNLVQMLLMQLFVYAMFANPFPFTLLVWTHFLFTTVGTIVFEFVRKLKRPGDDGTGEDTYTWYLGFGNSLVMYVVLLILNTFLFFKIATTLSTHTTWILLCSVGLGMLAALVALVHWVKRTQQTDQLMQLSYLVLYGIYNMVIYFLAIH